MKTLILYRSKTGLTKRYAEWLRDALNADMAEWKEAKHLSLADYDRLTRSFEERGGYRYKSDLSGTHAAELLGLDPTNF